MTATVQFRLLGPLEIESEGGPIPVPSGRQRVLLALLLLRSDQPVPVRELSEKLWDSRAPVNPRGTVQKYVMRLRRALAPTGSVIHTEADGYRLEVLPGQVDVNGFAEMLEHGVRAAKEGRLEAASARLAGALALWRAVPPMSNVVSDVLHRDETPRLMERYLQAVELRIDVDLQLGRHAELCAELLVLTGAHPLRERFWVQRMRALYAANRQGEALEVYRTATRLLADDLGIDPGPELWETHQQILAGGIPPAPVTSAPWTTTTTPRIRQLPMATSGVVGRQTDLEEIVNVLQADPSIGAPRLVAITGPEGAGKTTLAVHAAHRLADTFPDGQLFADLDRPADGGVSDVDELLAYVLRALGVRAHSLPPQRDDAIALYRSLTADRRLLVVLDGATSVDVVRSLLPGSATCAVLVTSRGEMSDLLVSPGAHRIPLGALEPDAAFEALRLVIGDDRVRAEQDGALRLVERCGGLPLAVRGAAAHLAARPGLTIASYLERLERGEPVPTPIIGSIRRPAPVVGASEPRHPHTANRAG
jgi:DNA-binding SARP family transcriptional activator